MHGPWLFKGQITAEELRELLDSACTAEERFGRARAVKADATKRFAAADEELTSWLAKARLVVMLACGSKWSESWIAAGFTHRSTNVPKRIGQRIELTRRLAVFFASRPQFEVPFATVTAADAAAARKKIESAETAARVAGTVATSRKRHRDAAEKRLRRQMRFTVKMLALVIGESDPRWQEFGLNEPRPDKSERPYLSRPALAPPVEIDFLAPAQLVSAETTAA